MKKATRTAVWIALSLVGRLCAQNAVLRTNTGAQTFFGTAAPGRLPATLPGALYSDTTNYVIYQCNAPSGTAAPACTSVAAGGWTALVPGFYSPVYSQVLIGQGGASITTSGVEDTALGFGALHGVTSGTDNTALGWEALYGVTTGTNNIGVGVGAMENITTGTYNIGLGAATEPQAAADTNELVIGYNVTGAGSNTAVIGNASVTDVYFGGTSGGATLHGTLAGQQQKAMLTSNYTNATNSFSAVTGLSFSVAASTSYVGQCHLITNINNVAGAINLEFTGPTGVSLTSANFTYFTSITAANGTSDHLTTGAFPFTFSGVPVVSTGAYLPADVYYGFTIGSTPGTFALNAKSGSTSATLTIYGGSYCTIQ